MQQSLEQAYTQTNKRNCDAGQQQNGFTGDGFSHLTDPTDRGRKDAANGLQQGCNSHSCRVVNTPFSAISQKLQDNPNDHREADKTEQVKNWRS